MPHWTYAWALVALTVTVAVSAITDARTGRIYNAVTVPAAATGLVGHALLAWLVPSGEALGLVGSLAGLAAGFVPLLLVWKLGGVNGGDAKLMAAVGALGGWRLALATMFYGFAIGALMAIIVMARRGLVVRTLRRVWRSAALLAGSGRTVDPSDESSPTVALGVALCLGAALGVVELALSGAGPWQKYVGL
jgi:prepilin peptidase CpaA